MDEKVWPKLLHLTIWTVLTGLLLWEIAFLPWDQQWVITVVAVTVVVWVGVGIWYAIWATVQRTEKPKNLPKPPTDYGIDRAELDELCTPTGGLLPQHQGALFVRALERPESVFSRITEHVESYHRSIKVRTTYTAIIEPPVKSEGEGEQPAAEFGYVVPLHLPNRGRILNGLRLFDAKGGRVSSLDAQQVSTFSAAVIRLLLRNISPVTLQAYIKEVESAVIGLISSFMPVHEDDVEEAVQALRSLPMPPGRGSRQMDLTVRVIRLLASVHPICVTVSAKSTREAGWPHSHRFSMERRIMPIIDVILPQKKPAWPRRFADVLREPLGVRLNRIYYVLSASTRAKSYHVEVEGPEGSYLAGDELLIPKSQKASEQLFGSTAPRLGQRRSHTYVNRNTYREPVFIATRFYERAPGSFATATLSALAATVVVWLIAVNETSNTTNNPALNQPWLIPALLAVPLAVATLSGLDLSRTPKHPSLLSRGINLATVALVIAAFMMTSLSHDKITVPPHLWILLPALGVSLVIVSGVTWILRLALERYFVQGKDK